MSRKMTGEFAGVGQGSSPWWQCFVYAACGVLLMIVGQRNSKVHLLATFAVVGAAAWIGVGRVDWAILILAIGLVWMAEGLNTAVERLADAVHPEDSPLIGQAKDVAAGAVLLAAITAAVLGGLVFWPH